ncbi:MAG: VOC family protein [Saprospiraceae bacterium]|nr:VOC family protein [Saprospiraceae bacterium]HMX88209.1 VOC family protein [Saprospiraceae bacterium]HMZ41036.1 VOC family protein [Saprospiraceae bacterium]HNA65880.1 VOC family protein [Saprospiraceae bacterium]HNB31843.1 VOC family protein [Saprospiraceae bacterium]
MKKNILLIIAFVFAGILNAQGVLTFNLTFNHLALSVKDVDRSADFYKKVLTLKEITNLAKVDDMRCLSLSGNKQLHLISIGKKNIVVDTAIHFAFATHNFDAFLNRMDKMKIPYEDTDGKPHTFNIRADGVKQNYFQDPDGYWIEVNNMRKKKS